MLTLNNRNCVLFRMGEKEILVFMILTSEFIQEILTMKVQKEIKVRLQQFKYYKAIDGYIKSVIYPLINNPQAYFD